MFNLLESHDIGRAHWRLGGSRTKYRAALTLLMAYAGVPCLYYGSEIGLSQSRDGNMPWCREPMPWDEAQWDKALLEQVKVLVKLRRETPVLHSGALRFLHAEPDALAFLREVTDADGHAAQAVAVASRRAEPHFVTLTLPADEWQDALSGERLGGGEVTLDAAGGRLLVQRR